MIVFYNQNDLPGDINQTPGLLRYWTATDPQLELWATNQESWYISFDNEQSALMFLLRYPEVASPQRMPECLE